MYKSSVHKIAVMIFNALGYYKNMDMDEAIACHISRLKWDRLPPFSRSVIGGILYALNLLLKQPKMPLSDGDQD
jgi:hypothetical protein